MKQTLITCIALLLSFSNCWAQTQKNKGYPERKPDLDVLPGFINPPEGYGNVPFFWWNGDTLNRQRLADQLDILSQSATDGFAVSYIHTSPRVDTLVNKDGYGLYGRTEPGAPTVFSDDWWDIWNWFSGECGRRGMGVGLDDYTVGWVGNGFYPDELDNMSVFSGYKGELQIDTIPVRGGATYESDIPRDLITLVAWPDKIELTEQVKNGRISWQAPAGKDYTVYVVTAKPGYVIHPEHGKRVVDVYFNRFESKMDAAGKKGMNYFFQDELSYPINQLSWSDDFQAEFLKRKGYDLTPYLPALKTYIGEITPKIRLDYCEVLMDLSEERYYKPVYDWHAERGLIYGCDNLSRGKNPVAYVDYFRAMSWFTAPGNDAPSRGSSFLETKVSSSISHLYDRPRTWLEAFHSMGWGSSGAWLTRQIDHHFMAGGNLVCMHGLYYSTHGDWWEWAPPCFHFRMPYWAHMKHWLKYTERMSYLLSQGSHVCDIALMYPTESMQAYPEAKAGNAFDLAQRLSNSGLDYDFIDFRSLRNAGTEDGSLILSDEKYKVIILADMKAMHFSSLQKILDFYRSGGIVLATGDLPKASSNKGEQDVEVDHIVKEIFGLSAIEAQSGKPANKQINKRNGVGWYISDGSIEKIIPQLITPDFIPEKGEGKVLHRRAGQRDIYMVTDVAKDSECFFRAKGKVELWDAMSGEVEPYPVLRETESGTYLKMNKDTLNSYLLVFSPGTPVIQNETENRSTLVQQYFLNDDWEVDLLPTLHNKWGDYRFPAFNGYIGAEARTFRYAPRSSKEKTWMQPGFNDSGWTEEIYGFGPQVEALFEGSQGWQPVSYSWQYGIWDNPGSQGYHGLKGKVDDRFFILDKGGEQEFRTFVYADKKGAYRLQTEGVTPHRIQIDKKTVKEKVYLTKGWHSIQVSYSNTKKIPHDPSQTGHLQDKRERSMVVLYPENTPKPNKPSVYATEVASVWNNSNHLMYDPYKGKYEEWHFRFTAAPGLKQMVVTVYGKELKAWVEGKEIPRNQIKQIDGGSNWQQYMVTLSQKEVRPALVAFSVKPEIGYQGTAILKEPVQMKTGTGLLPCGDWSEMGALRHYSGGMYYVQSCNLSDEIRNKKVMLSLGDVIATCEVKVNDQQVGILISPPYELDITSYIKEGKNDIEVLVYSTLANHYQTIPTPYRGDPKAGLLGPVSISIYE